MTTVYFICKECGGYAGCWIRGDNIAHPYYQPQIDGFFENAPPPCTCGDNKKKDALAENTTADALRPR